MTRARRVSFLWLLFGIPILILGLVTLDPITSLLGLAWIGVGYSILVLSNTVIQLDGRQAALESRMERRTEPTG